MIGRFTGRRNKRAASATITFADESMLRFAGPRCLIGERGVVVMEK